MTGATLRTLQIGMHGFHERPGGLNRVYDELSRALPPYGVAFNGVVTGAGPASLMQRLPWLRRQIINAIATDPPDLIVSHFALHSLPIIDQLRGRQLVIHFHGPWADEGALEGDSKMRQVCKRWIENLVYRRAAHAIVLSAAFARLLNERYAIPNARITVIPGGIDAARFRQTPPQAAARARLGWPLDEPVIVAVRRLVPRMGLENLIAAAGIIRDAIPGVTLRIVGRGPLHAKLAERIAAGGLEGTVKLLGAVGDDALPLVYRAADLSIVPSVALEGFGLVAAESLAAGTPCLVAPVGGLPDVVAGLSNALILPSSRPADIAGAVIAALTQKSILPDAPSCRAYAGKTFDWPIIAAQVAAVYREAVGSVAISPKPPRNARLTNAP